MCPKALCKLASIMEDPTAAPRSKFARQRPSWIAASARSLSSPTAVQALPASTDPPKSREFEFATRLLPVEGQSPKAKAAAPQENSGNRGLPILSDG